MSNTHYIKNKFVVLIAGPTAVGKSHVAIHLASLLNAEIFSADSRQIFKEMDIGTAKPSIEELASVKHHFINNISIEDNYSVGRYESEIRQALELYFVDHDIAIVCGGTGLYIKALTDGIDYFPDIPLQVVEDYDLKLENEGLGALLAELEMLDPKYYDIVDKHNSRRIIRALSVIKVSGTSYTAFLVKESKQECPYNFIPILLELPRDILYDRINQRVDLMVAHGLEVEAKHLYPKRHLRALDTVGYREFFDYFEQRTNYQEAIDMIKQNSRRYAKRQMTWFRKYGDWTIFSPDDLGAMLQFILQKRQ
ncbi:MAG TPA: tRNA (adenosine(37)-N6)-dimethylallyltransferase MiaA [Saprospiraceae bacterium]|nr:tRNA (adenosine(37)-N6)-dimethylallyltransferase MiaA [Saprospiraceae bacterium]